MKKLIAIMLLLSGCTQAKAPPVHYELVVGNLAVYCGEMHAATNGVTLDKCVVPEIGAKTSAIHQAVNFQVAPGALDVE